MGSLPNLHELGKEDQAPSHQKIGPALSNPQQHSVGHSVLTQEERNKILHRHSTHCKGRYRNQQDRFLRSVYDDSTIEQIATYSPISSRSTRNLTHAIRRRDSINSSIGANSVRRLIAVVRNTNSRLGPIYSRKTLFRNLIFMCAAHVLISATFLPFLALQGSVTVWNQPVRWLNIPFTINLGSFLLTIMTATAATSTLFCPSFIRKWDTKTVFLLASLSLVVFYSVHLYPTLYLLMAAYPIFGLILGRLSVARINFLMTISTKLTYNYGEEEEDTKVLRRTCLIRRVARAVQAAHDFGLIVGSVLTTALITITVNFNVTHVNSNNLTHESNVTLNNTSDIQQNKIFDFNTFLDAIFEIDEMDDRLCGSQACPSRFRLDENLSFRVLPYLTSNVLIGVYIFLCSVALIITVFFLDNITLYVYQDHIEKAEANVNSFATARDTFKDVKLQLAAPLAIFIGLEQAFMYSDFSKSYVICTLGIHRLNLVFLCMGLLQSIAACTLSMLLRTIRRYYVIAVGFTFHACLLMVLILWKPMGDDPALFYVISAAWGVCNAVWEMMNFTLLTGLYADNWEAQFSNSLFFRFLGLSVGFVFHGMLCNWIKLYFMAFVMLVAVVPFAWLEFRLENMRRIKNVSRL